MKNSVAAVFLAAAALPRSTDAAVGAFVLPSVRVGRSSPSSSSSSSVALRMTGGFKLPDLPDLKLPDFSGLSDLLSKGLGSGGDPTSATKRKPSPPPPRAAAAAVAAPAPLATPPFDPSDPSSLVAVTRAFLSSDLGVRSGSAVLDDARFVWIDGPAALGRSSVLNKSEYLAAGRFFDLRAAFPDLDYRAHDFRLDYNSGDGGGGGDDDEVTVRFTVRTAGSMRGPLRLRSATIEPNGRRMVCPPESVSVTYDAATGKVVRLVTGCALDRLSGNTGGLTGVRAAAACGGSPPSEWELYPPVMVVGRFFGRTTKPLEENAFLAPFPESVMVQLAKGVIASGLGSDDPDLLAPKFSYLEPTVGPLDKERYLEYVRNDDVRGGVPDLDPNYRNFRVDPYDPYRVWVDSNPTGTRTGPVGNKPLPSNVASARYEGPPEATSFAFDDDGFCVRITSAAVLDPLRGNTGGLGGTNGLLYATGTPANPFAVRVWDEIVGRIQKGALSPVTGVGPDLFRLSDGRVVSPKGSTGAIGLPPAANGEGGSPRPTLSLPKLLPAPPKNPVPSPPKPAAASSGKPSSPLPFFADGGGSSLATAPKKKAPPPARQPQQKVPAVALRKKETGNAAREEAAMFTRNVRKRETENAGRVAREEAAMFARKAKEVNDTKRAREEEVQAKRESEAAAARAKAEGVRSERERDVAASKAKAEEVRAERERDAAASKAEVVAAKMQAQKEASAAKAKAQKEASVAKAKAERGAAAAANAKAKKSPSPAPIKRAPAFSLFGSSQPKKVKATPPSPKASRTPKVKRSPTLSLFGLPQPKKAKATPTSPKASSTPKVKRSPTLSLFGSSQPKKAKASVAKAVPPKGVPVLKRWKAGAGKQVTGLIYGAGKSFRDGATVTTSPVGSGTVASGNVIQTKSGSKYFLE